MREYRIVTNGERFAVEVGHPRRFLWWTWKRWVRARNSIAQWFPSRDTVEAARADLAAVMRADEIAARPWVPVPPDPS